LERSLEKILLVDEKVGQDSIGGREVGTGSNWLGPGEIGSDWSARRAGQNPIG